MEAILPFKIKNEQKFFDCALKIGYNEMEIYKFIYVMQQSDLDTFPKMHDERIIVLIYGWELCEDYKQQLNADEWELPEELEIILKLLMPWSMDIWFSKEWDISKPYLKAGLIHCLNRARDLLMRLPDMMQINWDFLLLYNLTPWNVPYLRNITVTKDKILETGALSIETEELPATNEDISYVKLEQLPIIVLRLVKLFDQASIDMVKTLCMRVIAAWNRIYQTELETSGRRMPYVPPEDKRCLMLICHIYLMAIYEADDVKGYVIDNMVNNIRFYYQGFQNSTALYAMDNLDYTPARFIALTNIHLRVQKRDFFDFFIWNKYDTSTVNLFGVVSQAYKSYLLGNLLMELNNMNEDDFAANIPLYKRLMNSYVNEREKSELFLLNELEKLELQHYAHNILPNIKSITDFKSKICKGNRMSNIGNYENSDDTVAPLAADTKVYSEEVETEVNVIMEVEVKDDARELDDFDEEENSVKVKENELRVDPIFQNLPNNENILYYVYEVLAKKDYKGWHFAKVVLLMKIIDHELNMIETWRYHPGLTTDFMLNLEEKLSHHYVDLAKIFKDHAFIEQEFWLTAFYLNPTSEIYEIIKRLGMRNNRKRTEEPTKMVMTVDNVEAKYGLLSSTIDVKDIANLANTDDPDTDYNPLFSALHSLRVPDSLVKDMITAIFLPRNKSFAWVIDWHLLRSRCKMIMNSMNEKKRFVELNMAEANERLKYLIIDYKKYKNRPQLDYGTIEQGYENLMNSNDFDKESEEEEEDEEEEDFEDDEDAYENKNRGRGRPRGSIKKKEPEKVEDDNSQEDDPFLMGKRRTRARTAATLASILFQTLPRSSRRKRNEKDDESKTSEEKKKPTDDESNEKSSGSKSPITVSESAVVPLSPINAGCETKDSQIDNLPIKNIKEYLRERPAFSNSTQGFQHLVDIWDVEKTELQTIDENCVSLMESSNILQRAVKWKSLSKEINPLGCNEHENIDETEMVIENIEVPINKEYGFNMITACTEEVKFMPEILNRGIETPEITREEKEKEMELQTNITEQESEEAEPATVMEVDEDETVEGDENVVEQESKLDEFATDMEMDVEENVVEYKIIIHPTAIDSGKQDAYEENVPDKKENTQIVEEMPHVEDYSESIISDLSTEAIKDSGEIDESNTETNSKRNSFNYDIETEDKIELSQDLDQAEEDTIKDNEVKETELEYRNKEEISEQASENNEDEPDTKDVEEKSTDLEIMKETVDLLVPELATDNEVVDDIKTENTNQLYTVESLEKLEEDKVLPDKKVEEKQFEETEELADKIYVFKELIEEINLPTDNSNKDLLENAINIVTGVKDLTEKYIEEERGIQNIEDQLSQFKEKEQSDCSAKHIEEENIYPTIELSTETSKSVKDNTKEEDNICAAIELSTESPKPVTDDTKEEDNISSAIELSTETSKPVTDDTIEEDNICLAIELSTETQKPVTDDTREKDNISSATETQKSLQDNAREEDNICPAIELSTETLKSVTDETTEEDNICLPVELNTEATTSTKDDNKSSQVSINNTDINDLPIESKDIDKELLAKDKLFNIEDSKQSSTVMHDVIAISTDNKEKESLDTKELMEEELISANESNIFIYDSSVEEDASFVDKTNDEYKKTEPLNHTPVVVHDESTADSSKTSAYSTDSETTRNLKNDCLTKPVKVLVRKLRAEDLEDLRQPKIKLKRVNVEQFQEILRTKRKRVTSKVYLNLDDDSSSNSYGANTSSSDTYRPPKQKRKIQVRRQFMRKMRPSDSDNESIASEDMKLSKILSSRGMPSTSQSSTKMRSTQPRTSGPKSARHKIAGPKSSKTSNLIVTPRSASGLKLRISNAEQTMPKRAVSGPKNIVFDEVIQLSSSSSNDAYNINEMTVIEEEVIEIEEDNPLFEEEIII